MAVAPRSCLRAMTYNSKELFALTGMTPSISSLSSTSPNKENERKIGVDRTRISEAMSMQNGHPHVLRESFTVGLSHGGPSEHQRLTKDSSVSESNEYIPFENIANHLSASIVSSTREHRTGDTTSRPRVSRRKQQQQQLTQFKSFSEKVNVVTKYLPCTNYINRNEAIRKVFVVEEEEERKARFSWYHPGDTMVPRNWLKDGLLADISFYFYNK